ncbi:MAG: acetyltransferase [Agathobacter sp.]|nr:acetyltransferase [Agathobacter sp.]
MKLIIIGNTEHAATISNYIENTGFGEIIGFSVDKEYIDTPEFCGKPVIDLEKLQEKFSSKDIKLIMGIGYKKMGEIKKNIFLRCKEMGFSFENYIHPSAIVSKDVNLGQGNNILEGVIIESGVDMGDCNILFAGVLIGHGSRVGNYNTFAGKTNISGFVDIGNNCMFGINSTVKDNVNIKDYVLIGASAYAQHDIEEYEVLVSTKSYILEGKKSTDFL